MQNLYCISGLGADERVFQYLNLSFAKPVFINWINPLPGESLQAYATQLREKFIREEDPLILGLSLGGMLAVEIAKQLPKATVTIISSAKTKYELPFYWRIFKRVPVYKIITYGLVKQTLTIQEYFLGASSPVSRQYEKTVVNKTDMHFYKWAIGAIVSWKNKIAPPNVFHIHGSKDRLLPLRFVKAGCIINNGGHLMILENAGEISPVLKQGFTVKNKFDELNLAL
ncbi:alpha/beta hydrolase [Parafilimonas sp.]|uniref:alpha/beta hydrolase n=1 Tax=Parafilimonas sp. TaxID=1969739 RepID=UPI0039E49EC6